MHTNSEFRFDGGATWLNLLATRGQSFGSRPVERLATIEAAEHWLSAIGFPPRDAVTTDDLAHLVQLREALRDLAMAAVALRAPTRNALSHVRAVASAHTALDFADIAERGAETDDALSAIAVQALVTLNGPDRALLKECAEVDCRWVFLDTSGRRQWCPSPACASRGRVRAHRARQSAASRS
ncbi:CGNR zinc finger domain-containing protein [Agreia pratensis]|uniref:Putative stress-induced transcription regulator n=1 Tax=Agreia pratensis TaxID=150121 RepID=A0A1X7K8D7_9MICO|nr:CGNR zinc finger domain-containing protein [Agreia pratensis]MBF4634304.1 CGNR zinc finger domain-containing protein [Agreia pratensis]SMG36592.1 Putative stress-induced transcription regulator [Agreia pratensis]